MSQADEIRNYCIKTYVIPSRLRNDKGVFIPVADVHKNLHLSDRYPAVCSALGSKKFEDEANIRRVHIDGPKNGASTIFVFLFK
jgi:5-methylcytosine-specific restriction protein B